MALFDLNSYLSGSYAPQNNNAAPYISGIEGLSGGPQWTDPAMYEWLRKKFGSYEEGGGNPGAMPEAPAGGYGMQLVRAPGDGTMQRGMFYLDPKTGALTQSGDWVFDQNQGDSGVFGAIDKYLPAATTALLAYYGGQGLMSAAGAGGAAGEVSGMDLAADSATGGNSIANAASQFGNAANATNPALIDSYLRTPGYGASSAGAGGGAGTGLFGSLSGNISDAMKKIGIPSVGNLGDLAKVGGLLGAVGAGGQQGRGDYTGPMPTITRGNWSPTATPQYMDVAQPSLMPADIKKQANSGLWRYLGGMT